VLSTSRMASEQQHLEVVVELRPGADPDHAATWLRQQGLEVLPLVVGFLAAGDAATVAAAFRAEPKGQLPVPDELRAHVESVSIAPPKQLHGGA
jgi:hypothetical protein